jgi:hypothetical protein
MNMSGQYLLGHQTLAAAIFCSQFQNLELVGIYYPYSRPMA